jgi:hypothetical protein
MTGMRVRLRIMLIVVVLQFMGAVALAAETAALAKARALYNAQDYDGAIAAANEARRQSVGADAASLVLARAHVERYRQRADPADLASARDALRMVHASALGPRDRVDLFVGLGQTLFLGEKYGAAADLFDTALSQASILPLQSRLLLLDWWASALDREAQSRPIERRQPIFDRVTDRMEAALRQDPTNATASYWLAVAARGAGDLDRAWDAAVAGWVRSLLNPDTAATLRTDLDRLVTQALIPERARQRQARDSQDVSAALRAEWELIKQQWQ